MTQRLCMHRNKEATWTKKLCGIRVLNQFCKSLPCECYLGREVKWQNCLCRAQLHQSFEKQ